MKHIRFFTFVLILGTLVLSACGAAAAQATPAADTIIGGGKVEAMPVAFVGIVDSIAGDQWVISGTTVTVDASVVHNGPFQPGDRVKVEGLVNPDGSLTVSRVEAPTPQETATLPPVSADNSNEAVSNANTNDANVNSNSNNASSSANSNDDNSNTSNSNDNNANDDSGGKSNDDNSNSSNDNGDDKGKDDNSGKGGGDDKGGDDKGGNSNDD